MTHSVNPIVTDWQRQIIVGTLLGGSSIICPSAGVNCYLSMRDKNFQWLNYKAKELEVLSSNKAILSERTHRWHSKCYPIFSDFRNDFYNDKGRSLILDHLEGFQDIALAIWFGDCGKYRNGVVTLNTHVWGQKGSEVIVEYFKLLDYKPELLKERGKFRVRLDQESSAKFMNIIVPVLPSSFVDELL
jgi:hypothetical protein